MTPQIEVHLWSGLRRFTGGQEVVQLSAGTVGQMLEALMRAHPGLEEIIEAGVSVSVDGRIIASDMTEPLRAEHEIYLMQRLRGG